MEQYKNSNHDACLPYSEKENPFDDFNFGFSKVIPVNLDTKG